MKRDDKVNDEQEMDKLLDSLEELIEEADRNKIRWSVVWEHVRGIQNSYYNVHFVTLEERRKSQQRFQYLVEQVKERSNAAKVVINERFTLSEQHLKHIESLTESAMPNNHSDFCDWVLTIISGGTYYLLKMGLDAILGPFDERKYELKKCNERIAEGWAYFNENKSEMFGRHKNEAYTKLREVSDLLQEAWAEYKNERSEIMDRYHQEKQEKKEAWETRMQEKLEKLQDKYNYLVTKLNSKQEFLSALEYERDTARSETYREQKEEKIDNVENEIEQLQSDIDDLNDTLSDLRDKLG